MLTRDLARQVLAYADDRLVGDEPSATEVPGLSVSRQREPTTLMPVLYQPLFCLVLQGAKQAVLGERTVTFSEGSSVIIGIDLPTEARIIKASPAEPYVALALHIDMPLIRELSVELATNADVDSPPAAITAAEADEAIVDAMRRVFALLEKPAALPVLRPLLQREIHYWLLCAEHASMLRALAQADSHASKVGNAIVLIRQHFADTLVVSELAKAIGMSVSAFHHHFKAVTGTSPLQYQKRLRLMEARRLMQSEHHSVSDAAFGVGYESPTQFSREYSRMFGLPPKMHRSVAAPFPLQEVSRFPKAGAATGG